MEHIETEPLLPPEPVTALVSEPVEDPHQSPALRSALQAAQAANEKRAVDMTAWMAANSKRLGRSARTISAIMGGKAKQGLSNIAAAREVMGGRQAPKKWANLSDDQLRAYSRSMTDLSKSRPVLGELKQLRSRPAPPAGPDDRTQQR